MGNDGGSIPKRRELVKEAARDRTTAEVKESRLVAQEYYWTTDPISQQPLREPIVSDCSGKLYNKDTVLEFLVEGLRKEDAETATQGAIKTLKDVVEVKFQTADGAAGSWRCPVTNDPLGPGSRAVYLIPCGHAFCESGVKEVSGERCVTCDTEYVANDVIPIIPTIETDIARLKLRMNTLQEKGLTHSLKKASGGGKKRKKRDEAIDLSNGDAAIVAEAVTVRDVDHEIVHDDLKAGKNGTSGINNSSTASLTAKVVQEGAKKRKVENNNVRSLFSKTSSANSMGKSTDFMTRGFSIPAGAKR